MLLSMGKKTNINQQVFPTPRLIHSIPRPPPAAGHDCSLGLQDPAGEKLHVVLHVGRNGIPSAGMAVLPQKLNEGRFASCGTGFYIVTT